MLLSLDIILLKEFDVNILKSFIVIVFSCNYAFSVNDSLPNLWDVGRGLAYSTIDDEESYDPNDVEIVSDINVSDEAGDMSVAISELGMPENNLPDWFFNNIVEGAAVIKIAPDNSIRSNVAEMPDLLKGMGTSEWSIPDFLLSDIAAGMNTSLLMPPDARKVSRGRLKDILEKRAQVHIDPIEIAKKDVAVFQSNLPYKLTSCQIQAIAEIQQDLASGKPMNRILIGDVGFGKTEVALHAALFTLMSNKQVAIIVPNKTLAAQHYESFSKRFSDSRFRDKIFLMSSALTAKQKEKTLEKVKNCTSGVIIGTSTILYNTGCLNNIGLIIYDEEHCFGVDQKEQIRDEHMDIHVLWMSATPIPRTIALIDEKLMQASYLKSPPAGRKPIRTDLIKPHDRDIISEAFKLEFARDGQVFFVTPLIKQFDEMLIFIKQFVPEDQIRCVSGKTKKKEQETILDDFRSNKFQVLLSTKLIGIGVDIPNANTMFIYDPSRFGMAELTQLRGRIGRSDRQAYAYLLLDIERELSTEQCEKLDLIVETSSLGGGYTLARQDAEIRTCDDIFGHIQSGKRANKPLKRSYLDRDNAMPSGYISSAFINSRQLPKIQTCDMLPDPKRQAIEGFNVASKTP
jgi:superfamily II DNA or RNA helicase